jgi:RNA polymerase-binding transcription factor DksA
MQDDNVKPWDMLNHNTQYAAKEVSEKRYNICKSCPEFIDFSKQCKKCGCFMIIKTKLQKAQCPLGKW